MLRKESRFCKIFHAVAQGFGKGLDKGAASGGAGFVELYVVHGMIADADTLHILAADVQDAVYLWIEEFRRIVVGHRLHLALVQHEGSFDKGLPIAGRAGTGNMCVFRKKAVDFPDGPQGCLKRASVVAAVKGIEEGAVFCDQRRLGGGASGVNT
ncbi:hypothetical protein IMSAGC007_04836 [Lachnospiraceae bacterium]|nr:hypothetical protein IMSAGC007_04836 [Lachnospiraceae bacterium]